MSTAEVQIKIGTIADLTGVERAKASFTNLQGELQKKLSAKGIGMSLLEGLGIGSGFRIADQISDMIVKPFREAADYAKALEKNTENALDRFKALRDLRNAGDVEAQRRVLQTELKQATAAKTAAENSRANGVNSGVYTETKNEFGEMRWFMRYIPTAEEKAKIIETQELFDKAANAAAMFEEKQRQIAEARAKATAKGSADKSGNRFDSEAKAIQGSLANAEEWAQKQQDIAKAARESVDPLAQLNEKIRAYRTAAEALPESAADCEKAIAKLQAEFNRPELMRKSAEALEAYRTQLDAIDNNPLMTDKAKREARALVLAWENAEIRRQIALEMELNAVNSTPESRARIDQLNREKRVNESSNVAPPSKVQQGAQQGLDWEDNSKHYVGASEGFLGGAIEMLNEFGTLGDQIASSFKNVMGNAVQSISNGITGLIMRTQTWRQALSNIGLSILTSIVSAIVQMGVRWVATQIMMAAFGKAITAAAIATSIPLAMAATMVWAAPATLATIATFGGAAMQAPMSILSAQGLVMAGSLMQFAKGGLIPEGRRLIEVNEQGQEAVLNARATSALGSGFINAVNSGEFANATQYITRPGFSPELQEGGAGAIERQEQGLGTIAVRGFNAAHEIQQHLESRPGKKWIVDLIRQEARRV